MTPERFARVAPPIHCSRGRSRKCLRLPLPHTPTPPRAISTDLLFVACSSSASIAPLDRCAGRNRLWFFASNRWTLVYRAGGRGGRGGGFVCARAVMPTISIPDEGCNFVCGLSLGPVS